MIKYLRLLLLPFSVVYGLAVFIRNKLYDWGILTSVSFDIPVICVGNLVVGGSGKTPVTEYLVELLSDYRIAILSRGYGRATKGFIYADAQATALSIGDEPLQFYHKFPGVTVAVCEDRVTGINRLQAKHDLIILDDAYQHRSVRPGFSILLFEFKKLRSSQFLLPAGNMREFFNAYRRAHMIMVTKSPEQLPFAEKEKCKNRFGKAPGQEVFFSRICYGKLLSLFSGTALPLQVLRDKKVYLLTGIANPEPLLAEIRRYTVAIVHHDYPDHHSFDMRNLVKLAEAYLSDPVQEKIIVTTEKDAQRLFDVAFKELLLNLPVFYLPITIEIDEENKSVFDQKLLKYVSDTARNR